MSNDAKWRRICLDVLNVVWKNPDAWIFHAPVTESPELTEAAKLAYRQCIPQPMDLRTIRQSIQHYVSPAEFESNMALVFSNCTRFNKPGQDAYEMGKDVEKFFNSKWADKRGTAFELYRETLKVDDQMDTEELADPWRDILRRIFDTIRNDPRFSWFQLPVHEYPGIENSVKKQYYSLIRVPMDFSTIEKNVGIYPSPGEMRKDLELIVTNSVRFNPPESVVNFAARQLQEKINELFDSEFAADLASFKHMVGDWNKAGVKRILPDLPGEEFLPPPPGPQVVVRLKRTKTADEPVAPPVPPAEPPVKQTSNNVSIDREMAPVSPSSEWKTFAMHLLNELGQLRDESSSSKLSWIFQKPIFKYELPNQIKRLYLLSVTDLIDLQIIQQKLEKEVYDSKNGPFDFESDVRVMLDNCLAFNDETQYPHKVGFAVEKHFVKYWYECGLREKAIGAWERGSKPIGVVKPIVQENPNWNEIRMQASQEMVKPGLDCEHISATIPLNDELLYEWRVAQRFVMQDRRNKMKAKHGRDIHD